MFSMCSVCAHAFQCMCADFLIHATCCKHVHLVKRFVDARDGCTTESKQQSVSNHSEIDEAFELVKDEKENNFGELASCKQKLQG